MSLSRNILLWCSQNQWMKENIPKLGFVKRALKRFMPGELIEDAIREAKNFQKKNISTLFTHLGENINDLSEAKKVSQHYIALLQEIANEKIPTEVSLKLTQIGFDLSEEETFKNFIRITEEANKHGNIVWIDMEQSSYVARTIEFYKKVKKVFSNTGLCLQSYLYRTEDDLKGLLEFSPRIRLVKGAYNEPSLIAFGDKKEADENYFLLSKMMIDNIESKKLHAAFGTHDLKLTERIINYAEEKKIGNDKLEFQMLYGVRSNEQLRLASQGYRIAVLISYGKFWYPWYVRRLAERPANIWFVMKNLFTK